MKNSSTIELLRLNTGFWSQLGWCHYPPRKDWEGKEIVFLHDPDSRRNFHRDLYWAGIRIHTTTLFSGWAGDGEYDYEITDKTLEQLFSACGNEMLYLPRITLDPPIDWCRNHPEELVAYYPGIEDPKEIRRLVGSPHHDLLGYESARGKYTWGIWIDDRPNVNGRIGCQSFSSQRWLADAGEALRQLIRRLETGKYADRIAGYHLAYGMCMETTMFRAWSGGDKYADYGIGNRKAFFNWGIGKYGSLEKLSDAWRQPGMTEEDFRMPSPEQRVEWSNASGFLRVAPSEQICIDLDYFTSEVNCAAIEHFAKITKEESGGKPAGFFYGYYIGSPTAAYAGHLGIGRLLNSPYVDFLAGPKAYHTHAGDPGGEQAPAMSINRKKLFLTEMDSVTHMCHTPDKGSEGGDTMTADDTRTVLWREFSRTMMYRSGFYWMDLSGHQFDDYRIHAEIGRIETIKRKLGQYPAESLSEVLIVSDEESLYRQKSNRELHRDLLVDSIAEINLCGAPVDHYRFADLTEIDLRPYKCILFMNQYQIDKLQWEVLKTRFRPGAILVWHYLPGIFAPDYDGKHALDFCGMEPVEHPHILREGDKLTMTPEGALDGLPRLEKKFTSRPYPFFDIVGSKTLEVLARQKNGSIMAAKTEKNGHSQVYITVPCLNHRHYRRILEQAKIRFFAPPGVAIYADSRFVGIFPKIDVEFEFRPPVPTDCYDPVLGEHFDSAAAIPLSMPGKSAKFMVLGSGTWNNHKPKINREYILFPEDGANSRIFS